MELETKRGRFEVIDEGAGEGGGEGSGEGKRTTLVLVHGFPFAADSWRADAEALATSMRVIAPSMRGFGGSTSDELTALSIETMADDVAAVLDALGVTEPVVMGGLSMGGYVTLSFARKHPGRLRGLVLADTRAEPDSDEARANRDKAIARVERGDLAGFVDGLFDVILAPITRAQRPEIVERVRTMAMRAAPSSVTAALRALRDRPDARPGLSAISVPSLIVVGEHDALTPPAVARSMLAALPGERGRLHVIPDAGHVSNLEQPDAFREAVASFVTGL